MVMGFSIVMNDYHIYIHCYCCGTMPQKCVVFILDLVSIHSFSNILFAYIYSDLILIYLVVTHSNLIIKC